MDLGLEYKEKFFVRIDNKFYVYNGTFWDWYTTPAHTDSWKSDALALYPEIVFKQWVSLGYKVTMIKRYLRYCGLIE